MPSTTSRSVDSATALEIEKDIASTEGGYSALTVEPWLRFVSPAAFPNSGFVAIRYATGVSDEPIRPILRYWTGETFRDHILPASSEGAGFWIGRAPKDCSAIWISPTNRSGPFDFRVLEVRRASLTEVMGRAARAPKRLFFAASAGLVGLTDEAELNWRFTLGAEPLSNYAAWRKTRASGLDAQPATTGPEMTLFLDVSDASAAAIDESCASVAGQNYQNWSVRFLGAPTDPAAIERLGAWQEQPRFGRRDPASEPSEMDVALRLRAGDILEANAFTSGAAFLERRPETRILYADEIRISEGGASAPHYKPGWSPTLQRSTGYLGRAAFFRAALLQAQPGWEDMTPEDLLDRLAMKVGVTEVATLRRPLFRLPASAASPVRPPEAVYRGAPPSVSVVIPTRDKPELLEECLESLFRETRYQNYNVVLIDNDSVETRTHELLGRMQAAQDRLTILRSPGDFNFSSLSNMGAAASDSDYLLFLNNDTRILTPDWIDRLLYFATQPDIGAVGAKLLYPNRRVQHVGVLLGMGGVAGHFGAGLEEGAPGWLHRNVVPHEVSAVTGACLMVARAKFDAVGRFDAVNLPVDLNDVDLCLRLSERGWRTICHSQVVLIHHQSASRGGGLRLQQVYEQERRFFVERWRNLIRDDPYFHPGLSLYAAEESLP